MNRNNIYTVNPLYNGSTTQATGDDSVQSGGTTIIYQQGGGTGLTDAQKQKLDGIQEGAEVNQNAYSKVRLNGSDTLIIEAKNKTDILNMSGVYPIAIAINGSGGLDFTVSSDQTNTNAVVTQSQLQAAIEKLQEDKYWKVDEDGKLYTELDVYSHKEISAYGAGTGGGSTGGAGALYECADVLRDGDKVQGAAVGSILSYNGSHWYAIPQSAITPDLTNYATKSYVTQQINDLIGGAPGTLDTLKEIAEALGNNPNFATTVTEMINNIGLRVDQVEDRVVSLEDMFEWDKSASASDPSLWRIKAKKDLYGVGEISAYGLGETQPSVTTLAGLDDVTITSPANGQTLIYDSATSQWKNGTIIGGGNISLNGTVYKPVNGTITLPNLATPGDITTALNGYATQAWVNSQGFLKSNSLDNYVTLNTIQNITAVKTFQAGIVSTTFRKSNGTSSQFLKADGSVDGNLYALAYEGNQNKVQYSRHTDYLKTVDRRNQVYTPNIIENSSLSSYFTIQDTPYANWRSTISVKGWSSDYATWELTGPSHYDDTKTNERPYFRYGFNTTWNAWKGLAFLEDVSNLGDVYFNGQAIYSDYGHWVVGLIRIGTADIEDKYISGEMIYRRSNGIYANGSVRFNLIKKYQTTSMFAGVLYVGYGINTDQDAPRLCTFTYQGVKWGGLCWRAAASLHSIKTIIYDNSSTDTPFYVKYYNSQSGEVQNTEINNSISVLGSDIDIFPISSNGKFYTSSGRMDIHSAGNDWAYMRYTTDGRFYDIGLSSSRNTGSAMNGETGNFEIRPDGSSSNGIFVRYSDSSYGRLGVVSRSTQECSISYWNNAFTSNYPLWTVGAGIRNQYSFDWLYHNQGYKATLDSEGKLFVNVRMAGNPYYSLTIGDHDTGLSWVSDGVIGFRSNAKDVGFWGYTDGRLFNCYFREPSGVSYEKASLMINGNGSTISPSIGFHQPGVVGCNLRVDNDGNFLFEDASNYKNVYAYNFVAAGWLYSTANSCEVRIGSQNASYVHITNNKSRPYYMDNRLDISGHVIPYSANIYDLGESGKPWRQAYISNMHGSADAAGMLNTAYTYGQQPNPQTYFGSGTGLKVAMTGVSTNGAYWSDTLWVNGYYGTDVPKCTALHFPRDGSAEMYISSQETKSTNYGTRYRFWSSKNSNKLDAAWSCSTLNASGRILTASDIYSQSWVRTVGSTGWYSESYGGGWHMTDSTWLRAYNDKQIYTGSASPDAFYTLGGVNASGRIYAGSYIETHGGLVCAGVGNSGGAFGFNVYGSFYGNASHGGIEIGASDNVLGIGVRSNDNWYIWWTNSGSIGSSSNKSYIFNYNGSSWNFIGSVVASGEVTAYSDARLKSNIHTLDYRGRLIPRHYVKDGKQSIGFIAQEVQILYPETVLMSDDKEHYLSLNYNALTAVLAAQLNDVDDEVTLLKKRVEFLEKEVKRLSE